ncbi:MAG: DNA cytosine methyltransferase [Nitrososphaerota archaeon]
MNKLRVLDLFCGAGGLSLGFKKAGFQVTGVDILEDAGQTYRLNMKNDGKFIQADLSREIMDGQYDIIIGGPPCKPWSSVNTVKRGKVHRDYELLSRFFDHVEYHLPRIFILENVPPVANDETLSKHIKRLVKLGYSVSGRIIAYSEYGAPTRRRRFILFGTRESDAYVFFDMLSSHLQPAKTVRDAIWKLRDRERGEVADHVWPELRTIPKYMEKYEHGKFGWYILKWDEPAPSFGNVMKTYILHPDALNGNGKPSRVISVKEASLIMGFDTNFIFPENVGLGLKYQMIADAVSPVFSYVAAKTIKQMLF